MLEELVIFFIILCISLVVRNTVSKGKRVLGPFYPIVLRLEFIGVVFHEVSHWVMSVVVGSKPKSLSIKWRNEKYGFRSPHGSVKPENLESLLQAVVIVLAPLYFSTWLIFLFFFIMLSPANILLVRVIAGFLCISLVLGAAPSTQDFRCIGVAFRLDPSHSMYQILLVICSGLILWGVLLFTQVQFILDIFYYLSIAGIYFVLKGSIFGIKSIIYRSSSQNYQKPSKVHFKGFTRRHYKPKKPHREW
ncbi:MAG: hypothetical protein ACFFBK_04905 [Promethearchaeota archaeon]